MKNTLLFLLLLCSSAHAASNVWKTLTLSYESRYVLYGYDQGQNLLHADANIWMPINERLSVWAGSWYGTQPNGSYNEIDFYAGADFQLSKHLSAGLAYSLFNYIETPYPTSRQAHEISGHLTLAAGPLSISLRDLYDSEGEGHLARATASLEQPLTDTLSLELSGEYGWSFDYFAVGNGPNHALVKLSAPWKINDTLSIKPFIAHSFALDVLDAFETDRSYGGLSLIATF
jgi:hypothetical protein